MVVDPVEPFVLLLVFSLKTFFHWKMTMMHQLKSATVSQTAYVKKVDLRDQIAFAVSSLTSANLSIWDQHVLESNIYLKLKEFQ